MSSQSSTSRPTSPSSASSTSDSLHDHTPPSSAPPSAIHSPSQSSKILAALPTPFWPVSLRDEHARSAQSPQLPLALPAVPACRTPESVAADDIRTPDAWVRRNPELIRLTGKHPLNVEGKLSDVFGSGFLTPAHLHFVRNHGAVPHLPPPSAFLSSSPGEVSLSATLTAAAKESLPGPHLAQNLHGSTDPYANWTVRVHGHVTRPQKFTIEQLAETFQVVTLPVTLVCAGNRRKEQNVVRKSLGFDWGAAGVSTALWTGVYLADILKYVQPIRRAAKYVIFEGADELPKGPYGTSQKLSWAADKARGMLIAWAMNGLPLEPDHGFPIRLIVPGQIGGRMVKWLTRIEISDVESDHYLHYWDNKVLPMQLTPEQARDEPQWWYDPKYIITELNVNSAIAHPAHGETLTLPALVPQSPVADQSVSSTVEQGEYVCRGYAYAGGGRRITRVELSLDDGRSWRLADIEYPEDQFRRMKVEDPVYGLIDLTERDTCFCWCFWTFHLPYAALAKADSLTVRAMDESMNTQPRDMYLNATSMMNNWWFRIAIRKTSVENGLQLCFEHPAVVGTSRPGWMDRMKAEGRDILRPDFATDSNTEPSSSRPPSPPGPPAKLETATMTNPEIHRKITVEEFKAQAQNKNWFVIAGEIYDATGYLKEHPGGADSILLACGEDATEDFMAIHSVDAKMKLAQFHIGALSGDLGSNIPEASVPTDPSLGSADASFLHPKIWKSITLTEIRPVNHDSLIYRFSLPSLEQRLGLPAGQHVFARLRRKDTGKVVQRAYTPVSLEDARGSLELLVKIYFPCDEYPEGGKMTVGFDQLQLGDTIEVKGPLGSFVCKGSGVVSWKGQCRDVTEVGLVCGGSGITPILQVIRSVLHDPEDKTRLWLISSNKTEVDILCREELDALLRSHNASGRFRLHYTLGRPPAEGWTYDEGRISQEMLGKHLPQPGPGRMVLACGPPAMVEGTVRDGLRNLGWDVEKDFVVF